MEHRMITIHAKSDNKLSVDVIPGHFATNHSHINYYIDMTGIKHRYQMAKEASVTMAADYGSYTRVDTIICMDGMEMIGGLLARELTKVDRASMNSGGDICVISPEFNTNGQLIFRDNIQSMVMDKNVILLLASATTGKTINRSLECIKYYGGEVIGVSSIFSAITEKQGVPVHAIFTVDDIQDYRTYSFENCPFCSENQRIDAIVNSYGYSKI